jgi:muramoyltetrapeptide carboxypeptidase LdcA involved in peptidoglycan recycling
LLEPAQWWQTPLLRPRALKQGDKIAVVSPSWGGPATFLQRYEAGKQYIEATFGLHLVEMPHALAAADWIDQNPKARADDLMHAFSDTSIAGIIASIGGDDAIRLIPHINLAVIRDNPKIFIGYSDPTALHFACLKAGIGSLHGPTIMSGFAENGGMSATSRESFHRAAFGTQPMGELPSAPEGWTVEQLDWGDPLNQHKARQRIASSGLRCLRGKGAVTGPLIGGCAEVLEMLKGTPWWPPLDYWDGAILFYETSEEAPSDGSVLRWMRNYAAQGILSRISGIILGRPGGQMNEAQRSAQEGAILRALDEQSLHDLPVIADLDIGHTDPILTLPYGAFVKIECSPPKVHVLESAVQ